MKNRKFTGKPRIYFRKDRVWDWYWYWDVPQSEYRMLRCRTGYSQDLADNAQNFTEKLNSRARIGGLS